MARRPATSRDEPAQADAERLRNSLSRLMKEKGFTVTGWAKKAGITEGTLRSFLGGRTQTLTHATLLALANGAQEPVMALLAGKSFWAGTTQVDVTAEVSAAETTQEFIHRTDKAKFRIQVPLPSSDQEYFGALILDDSANELWRAGSILVCTDFDWTGEFDQLSDHDIVIVQEKRAEFVKSKNLTNSLFKITVRQLVTDESGVNYLMMRSKNPRHRNSIILHQPIIGTELHGPFGIGLGSELTIIGKVLATFTFGPPVGGSAVS